MKQYSQVKHQSLETFVNNLNDLSVELVIDSALRENRKRELAILIDEALVNRNNELFDQYSEELIQLEDLQS
ncbi:MULTISPECIES: IDEAL domain-containing protein [Mammaliicoccus]|uniref:IDEAL domain-containing protein n=1 Tax=Mammaliicoccus lentus TaxID=42858 RepID=A0AAP1WM10_MAMLE|nr:MULTISPECIES: IDEAL domain-containing protein [Mammaliicoccus]HBV03373.1 IDEAL domain-containing protein [Staphylococcus sp.]HIS18638.1 IDEAL domain-containing protein [Candidatus Coprovivens excrementavium]MBF0748978.1 IDEAL domain-containing protein [Mammaliicoccus lentus]MBF0795840.1 IDEAL domain-containing protein [Mammaliicoccus lentus]MBF0841754.1 IDEAL domain-containing protein [Mammaliicoccus lentus]